VKAAAARFAGDPDRWHSHERTSDIGVDAKGEARNIMERLPKSLNASVRCVLRQAWELDDAAKAERLLRNLAQRLERDWSGVAGSILEGVDEILTGLALPKELRRSLACTNIIDNAMGRCGAYAGT